MKNELQLIFLPYHNKQTLLIRSIHIVVEFILFNGF